MARAKNATEMRNFFGDFAKRIKLRQEKITGEIIALDKQMERLAIDISAAFTELKKFEIAQENAKNRAEKEVRRKETIQLDEIAGQQHRRKKDEG
jgi:flagellar FliJ protein